MDEDILKDIHILKLNILGCDNAGLEVVEDAIVGPVVPPLDPRHHQGGRIRPLLATAAAR